MANLKELRTRISSIKNTKQMTNAMKMVSAAKLRKAQQALVQVRPYAARVRNVFSDVVIAKHGDVENPFFEQPNVKNLLIIDITSNRGLCGAFNSNVVKKTEKIIENYKMQGILAENIDIYAFGKRGADSLIRKKYNVIKSDFDIFDELKYENVVKIAQEIIAFFTSRKYDKIEIVYNSFKNAATQILSHEQFLPVEIPEKEKSLGDFVYEPDFEKVLEDLIPQALTMQIYKALLESNVSEHGARMTAMHKATDTASDMIHDLSLEYNKARQSAITNEILEIVGGAEALNK
ncbi:MAG: ATP synthase F1 subunit gamma [Bacteroidota bacterium]|nr:ATP synthase F1 subunit gamma [Bacteroidota bacterium]